VAVSWFKWRDDDSDYRARAPTAKDFHPEAVQKAVLRQTIQHPMTVYPGASSLVGLAYFALISANPIALGIFLGGGAIGAGAWVVNFFMRGRKLSKEHIDKLKEAQEHYRRKIAEDLEQECRREYFYDGAEGVLKIKRAFEKLKKFLEERAYEKDEASAIMYVILAEDSYNKGVELVKGALDIHKVLKTLDMSSLEREKRDIEGKIARLREGGSQSRFETDFKILETKLASVNKRMTISAERRSLLKELLAQAERQEGALEIAHLELVDLMRAEEASLPHMTSSGNVRSELEHAIDEARQVEEKLRSLKVSERQ